MFATHALPPPFNPTETDSATAVTPWDVLRRHSHSRLDGDRQQAPPTVQRAGSADQAGASGDGRRGPIARRSNTALGQLQSAIGSMFRSSLARQESGPSNAMATHPPLPGTHPSHQHGSGSQSGLRNQQGAAEPAYRELGNPLPAQHGWSDPFGDDAFAAAHPNTASWPETMSDGSAADHSPSASDRPLLGDLIPAPTFTYREGPLEDIPTGGSPSGHQAGLFLRHQQSPSGVVHEAWGLQDAIPSFHGSFHQQLDHPPPAAPSHDLSFHSGFRRQLDHPPPAAPSHDLSFHSGFHRQLYHLPLPTPSHDLSFHGSFHQQLDGPSSSAIPGNDPFTAHLLHGTWGSPHAMDGFPGSPPQSSLDGGLQSAWGPTQTAGSGGDQGADRFLNEVLAGGVPVHPSWFSPSTPQTRPGPIMEASDLGSGAQQEWGPPMSPPVAANSLSWPGSSGPLVTTPISQVLTGAASVPPVPGWHLSTSGVDMRSDANPGLPRSSAGARQAHAPRRSLDNLHQEQAVDWGMPSNSWSDALLEAHSNQHHHQQQQQHAHQSSPPSWHADQAAGPPHQGHEGSDEVHQVMHRTDSPLAAAAAAAALTAPEDWHSGIAGSSAEGASLEDASRELLVVEDDGTAVWHDAHQVPVEPMSPPPQHAQ